MYPVLQKVRRLVDPFGTLSTTPCFDLVKHACEIGLGWLEHSKANLSPTRDHLRLLYVECLTAASFLFFYCMLSMVYY